MTSRLDVVAACVARYAARLHAAVGTRHHVASPLGAWLLLALAGPATRAADREALTDALGCDVEVAAGAAADLLAHPHPLVAAAAGVWTTPRFRPAEGFQRWLASLPDPVSTGDLPSQPDLDAWVREHTFGLIDRFPVDTSEAYLVLVTALATRVSWLLPFQLAPASDLGGSSPWAGRLSRVLRTPAGPGAHGHSQFIAAVPDAGDVIVHAATAVGGLLVVSVGAQPGVLAERVIAAAHDLGRALATGGHIERRDLVSLPLGDAPLWVIREVTAPADSCSAVLPAWSASSRHDLTDPALGFAAAQPGLAAGGDPWDARQLAMARYSRTGFEAAAVTTMAIGAAARIPARHREAELRFARPYAVVAFAADSPAAFERLPADVSEWQGIPVFSAWVSEPEDAADEPAPVTSL